MRDLRISATDLGYLSAFYYYAYVFMQFPTGLLVDSLGARKLLVFGAIAAAAGTFLFAFSDTFFLACFGRAIMGAATAIGWVVTLKLATHWFPPRVFATLSGLGLLIGNIGALFAQVPLRLLVERSGWRTVGFFSGAFILAVGLLAWLVVRDDPSEAGYRSYAPARPSADRRRASVTTTLRRMFAFRNTWLIFFAQGGFVGAILSFTGLWGPPFLRARFGLKPSSAAAICSVMILCWAAASPLFGYFSDRIGRRKPLYQWGAAVAAAGWLAMFYLTSLPLPAFVAIAAITSLAAGAVILGFAYGKESTPIRYLGAISGTVNAGNMIGPMLLQPAIGWLLDRQWSGALVNGARIYAARDFEVAFTLIVGWAILTCVLTALTRETYCRQNLSD
jgi:sugar phosphate permease